jgi:hypothetical protein
MPWVSPFSQPGRWFKGNLHTHTTQSDGRYTPEQAIAWYRERGYDFLALSDHWVLTTGRTFLPADDFITITAAELHGPTYHMLALGLSALPDQTLADSPQALAAAVQAAGGLAFCAHPYWTGQTSAQVAEMTGIVGLEVFNSTCAFGDGRGFSSVHWDDLLAQGRPLHGLAVDDTHWRGEQGQGFIMVRAEALEERAILDALRQGHFYASTGPTINDLRVVHGPDGRPALRVHCSPCTSITYYASGPLGHHFAAAPGELLQSATLAARADQVYLRVECRDAQGRIAWSNAVIVSEME